MFSYEDAAKSSVCFFPDLTFISLYATLFLERMCARCKGL